MTIHNDFIQSPLLHPEIKKGRASFSLCTQTRARCLGKFSFGLAELVKKIVPTQFGYPPAEDHPAAKSSQVITPSPVPFPPSLLDIMKIQEDYWERKNIQPDLKHMPEPIKSSHNHLDRVLHFFGGQGLVGNEERKISIIVLPPDTLSGKKSVLLLESLG